MPKSGAYHNFSKDGSYNCIVCDENLFNSEDKYHDGTGWPAFHTATGKVFETDEKEVVYRRKSSSLKLMKLSRSEVRCESCGAHLGFVFNNDLISHTGQRYCINSACLDFVAAKAIIKK